MGWIIDESSTIHRLPLHLGLDETPGAAWCTLGKSVELCCSQLAEHGLPPHSHGRTTGAVGLTRMTQREHAPHHRGGRGAPAVLSAGRGSVRQRCPAVLRLGPDAPLSRPTVRTRGRAREGLWDAAGRAEHYFVRKLIIPCHSHLQLAIRNAPTPDTATRRQSAALFATSPWPCLTHVHEYP